MIGERAPAKVLDLTLVEEAFGALDGNALDMLGLFVEKMSELLDEIRRLMDRVEVGEAREQVHRARSAAGSIGGTAMMRHLAAMEEALIARDLSAAQAAWDEVPGAFDDLARAIGDLSAD